MANLRIRPRVLLRGLALLASLAALGWIAQWMLNAHLLSEQWIDAEVAGHGLAGYAIFIGVGALATALGFPRQVVAFLGGYAFGAIVGTELALVATILGCAGTFLYARGFARSLLARRLAGRVRQFDEFVGLHPFQMTMIVRLLPVGSNVLTNLVAGVSRVRPAPFFAGSAVGYLPQTLAFALAGSGVAIAPVFELVLGAALFVASALLGIALYRRHRHGTALEAAIDEALEHGEFARKDAL
jgi:uncharacterized membrane protein YdjX (TVP38/TMEM64 family)